ncbi:MAG: hypothetical protein AAF349_12090, partial [Cyanobacteria bacterium P01_A01_bin.68]
NLLIMPRRKNFRWRYQPRNLKDISMLNYISNSKTRSNTDMILIALRAFWLPLAIANSSEFDEITKREIVNEAITIFIFQMKQFSFIFGDSVSSQLVNNFNQNTTISVDINDAHTSSSINVSTELNIDKQKEDLGDFEYNIDSFNNW